MITKAFKVFPFSELKKEIQDKIIIAIIHDIMNDFPDVIGELPKVRECIDNRTEWFIPEVLYHNYMDTITSFINDDCIYFENGEVIPMGENHE